MTPHRASITQIGPTGVDLSVDLAVRNPNRVDLSVRSVTAHVLVDGQYDLGSTTVAKAFTLPAEREVELSVPLSVPWKDVASLTMLALSNRDVPYTVDGVVALGGDVLNVELPFQLAGTLSHADLVGAAMRSLPTLPLH
jgi:LEA14-like dessication related protein